MAYNQRNRRFSLVLLLFLISAALCGALWMRAQADGRPTVNKYYVTPNGQNDKTGDDWANARTLEEALTQASINALKEESTEILCSSGDYNVPLGTASPTPGSFIIAGSNIKLYGGYAGNPASPDEKAGVSRLIGSGDSVVKVMSVGPIDSGAGIIDGIVIDGFTITSGDAQPHTDFLGSGGGICIAYLDASVSVSNCTITGNSANDSGGGIYNSGSLDVTNCTFTENGAVNTTSSSTFGGALYNARGGSVSLTSCTFTNNKADTASYSQGGAICTYSGGSLDVTNCTFRLNVASGGAGGYGGAIFICEGVSSSRIINSTFSENSAIGEDSMGGGVYDANGTAMINSILWGNNAQDYSEIFGEEVSSDIQYCVISGDYGDYSGFTNIISADPHLQWNTAGYYALPVGSSAIDAGISSGDWGLAPSDDIRGVSRPQGSAYDIGAYEYEPSTAPDLSQTSLSLKVGSSARLVATSAASETFTWSSDNEGVASVSAAASAASPAARAAGVTGPAVTVRAVGSGDAVITVTGSASGLSSTCSVHVTTNGSVVVDVPPVVAQKVSADQGEVLIHFGLEEGAGGVSIPGYQTVTGIPNADLLAVAPVLPTKLPP